MRGREGEDDEAERGSRDGDVEDAEKGLVGDIALVPDLLGDPCVDDDSSAS